MKAEYIDHMGTDLSVVNAARVSFSKESEWLPAGAKNDYEGVIYQNIDGQSVVLKKGDAHLIQFLARGCTTSQWNELIEELWLEGGSLQDVEEALLRIKNMATHWTPFAHTSISLLMEAPVPIRTHCFKHKQGFVENEESRRYISGEPVLFTPDHFRVAPEGSIKQGSGGIHPEDVELKDAYQKQCQASISMYLDFIRRGVCPEQARFLLPQGVQVKWRWTGNLYAFASFFNKRTDPHAQKEVQELARAVGKIIEPLFPVSWAALTRKEVSTDE